MLMIRLDGFRRVPVFEQTSGDCHGGGGGGRAEGAVSSLLMYLVLSYLTPVHKNDFCIESYFY